MEQSGDRAPFPAVGAGEKDGGPAAETGDDCGFTWAGKAECVQEAGNPSVMKLRPCPEESADWDKTGNLYIEGDSLDALKLLQKGYRNSIRLIYIDPPYNTGNDFIFRDDFSAGGAKNSERPGSRRSSAKHSHAEWCSMMYPRLKLARELLTDDGLLFLSIDDNEIANLRQICDEIFGEENYINLVTVKSKASSGASGGGEDKRLKKNTEYIYIYARMKRRMRLRQPEKRIPISEYRKEHRAHKTGFYYTRILEDPGEKELLADSDGFRVYARKGYRFSTVSAKMAEEHLTEGEVYGKYFDRIFMVTNAQTSLLQKVNRSTPRDRMLVSYEYTPKTGRSRGKSIEKFVWNKTLIVWLADSAEKRDGVVYKKERLGTLWDDISWGRLDLQGGVPFKNGKKPLKLLDRILRMAADRDSTVLDFFSGSATTAHVVMRLNAEDGGSRKFILVQLPEPCGKNTTAFRAGFQDICGIGLERIRKAGAQIAEAFSESAAQMRFGREQLPPDVGFRVLRLEDRPDSDDGGMGFLIDALLMSGLPLSLSIEKTSICGRTVFFAGDTLLAACPGREPDPEILRSVAARHPQFAAFSKDSADPEHISALLSPGTRVILL